MKSRSPYWLWLSLALLLGLFSQRDRLITTDTSGTADAPGAAAQVKAGPAHSDDGDDGSAAFARAFAQQRSNIQLSGAGEVIKVLPDDNKGSRHQRLLVRLAAQPGQTRGQVILIAHNIDLAPRINDIAEGDRLAFAGEYEWTDKGGVLHWTHHDPAGRHPGGWLRHDGQVYH